MLVLESVMLMLRCRLLDFQEKIRLVPVVGVIMLMLCRRMLNVLLKAR